MKTNPVGVRFLIGIAFLFLSLSASAQTSITGTIEGRVINARSGEYLEKARVSVEGTSIETFTDTGGFYRLTNVPAGSARVRIFYTGLPPETQAVPVASGAVVRRDIN